MPNPHVSHIQLGSSIYDIYDEAAHNAVNNLQSGLGEADSSIEDLTTKYNTVNGLYNMLNSQVDGLETRMGTAESDIDTAQGDITNLKTKQSSQASQISALQSSSSSQGSRINSIEAILGSDFTDQKVTFSPNTNISAVDPENNSLTFRRYPLGNSGHYLYSVFGYMEATIQDISQNVQNCQIVGHMSPTITERTIYNLGAYTVGGLSIGDPWVQGSCYMNIFNDGGVIIRCAQTVTKTAIETIYYRCSCCFIV